MKLCTAAQARAMDEYTINTLGVPSIKLMERASEHLAQEALRLMGGRDEAAVFCGHGNNGGDGIGAALELIKAGKSVRVFLVGDRDKLTPDTGEMAQRLRQLDVILEDLPENEDISGYLSRCGVLIDAIYGFSFHLPLREPARRACRLMNSAGVPILAADIPSGVETDTGLADEDAVKAHVTVTFSSAKIGQYILPGTLYCGDVLVRGIGAQEPPEGDELPSVTAVEAVDAMPKRPLEAHKGMFGKCLIVAGCKGYTGAASFSSHAAVRSGAGLVFLAVPEAIYEIEAIKNDEAMAIPMPCDIEGKFSKDAVPPILDRLQACDACLVGPGLGLSPAVSHVVRQVVANSKVPLVIDADGINAVAGNIDILDRAECPIVLTPHDVEFGRLGGNLKSKDRLTAARDFAMAHKAAIVLKGYHTIIAFPDGEAFVNTTGNPGMAKGGSGDVLSGMLLALLGQGLPFKEAVVRGVYLHGLAGDMCSQQFGEYSMTPTDIIHTIKDVMR